MATIKEDYVSFETAKLLKEKGFEGYSNLIIYDENAANAYIKELQEKHLPYSSDDPKLKEFYYTKPTLQMAMKWLREIHNIHIVIKIVVRTYGDTKYYYELYSTKNKSLCVVCDIYKGEAWDSNEKACEAAINYCIEHLIWENQDRAPLNIVQDALDWEEY